MADPCHRIQEHLGQALRKLSQLRDRAAARQDTPRDVARCLADLRQVAQELDHAFDAIKVERQRLAIVAHDADAAMRRARNLFGQSPSPCLVLHREGAAIADANEAASRLLNVSHRHLIGKTFTNFLQQDRELFLQQLQRGAEGVADQWHITLRPRERALVRVLVSAIPENEDTAAIVISPAVTVAPVDDRAAGYAGV